MPDQEHYRSYLIRFQRGQGQSHWRATLQDTRSAQVFRFATEQDLMHYLLNALRVASARDGSSDS